MRIMRFMNTLVERMVCRGRGTKKGEKSVGASNRALNGAMDQLKLVGDLCRLRDIKHESGLAFIESAIECLVLRKLIPSSAKVDRADITAAWQCVSPYTDQDTRDLYRVLAREAVCNDRLASYLDLVTRVWLISPVESVVESMASVLNDVYGAHRQLDHANGEKELLIRWNGPEPSQADPLLEFVQQRERFSFKRRGNPTLWESLPGVVMRRLARFICPLAKVFCI